MLLVDYQEIPSYIPYIIAIAIIAQDNYIVGDDIFLQY